MALQNRRARLFLPNGLHETAEKMTKGMLVSRRLKQETGEYELYLPTSDADEVYGIVDLRQDSTDHVDSYYDEIPAGVRAVANTLMKDDGWGTDQFTGALEVGDLAMPDYANKGKIKKCEEADIAKAIFRVVGFIPAGQGAEKDMVDVEVIK